MTTTRRFTHTSVTDSCTDRSAITANVALARRRLKKRLGPEWSLSDPDITIKELPGIFRRSGKVQMEVNVTVDAEFLPINWLRRLEWAMSDAAFEKDWPPIIPRPELFPSGHIGDAERHRQAAKRSAIISVGKLPWC